MSTSRATYLPRWSSQLTEQLLSYKPGSPSPPPPPPPAPPLNDSGTASIIVDMPNQENGKQKAPGKQGRLPPPPMNSIQHHHDSGDNDHHHHPHSILELWSQLAQQIPSQQQQPKKKMGRISPSTVPGLEKHGGISQSPSQSHHHDSRNPENDSIMDDTGRWPLGLFLFWFGFLCPLLWWIGAFWPRHADRIGKMAHRWQWINRIMSITFCILLFFLLLAIGIWYHFSSP